MRADYSPTARPGLSILSPDQINEILMSAFLILERTGTRISHPSMLSILKDAGARVDGERVTAWRSIVQKALDLAPKGLMVYDQAGRPAMRLWGRESYFGTSTASPKTRDALTGEIHETRLTDLDLGAKVADALPHIDFVMPFGSAQDCPTSRHEAWELLTVARATKKPVVFCPYSPDGIELAIDVLAAAVGGEETLRRRPFAIAYPEPIAPLTWPEDVVSYMITCARRSVPQLVTGAQLMGLTAPVTLAGTLAQATAESLFSNLMVQAVNPGSPVFMAAIPCSVSSRNGLVSMAGPEYALAISAQAEIARRVGLPSWGTGGMSDSHVLDAQAGAESGLTCLIQALAGLNLIHDVGYLGTGIQCSAAMLVFGDEVVAYVKRIVSGFEVNAETLAADVIDKVGPGGNYLTHGHTVKHLRSEVLTNRLFVKTAYDQWRDNGAMTSEAIADARVKEILAKAPPSLMDPDLSRRLEDLIVSRS
jgi:trimethylamine--corrinoid protein Co-methyltransferase